MHAVVWESAPEARHAIVLQMARHLLQRHHALPPARVRCALSGCDATLAAPPGHAIGGLSHTSNPHPHPHPHPHLTPAGGFLCFDYRCVHRGLASQGRERAVAYFVVAFEPDVEDSHNFPQLSVHDAPAELTEAMPFWDDAVGRVTRAPS